MGVQSYLIELQVVKISDHLFRYKLYQLLPVGDYKYLATYPNDIGSLIRFFLHTYLDYLPELATGSLLWDPLIFLLHDLLCHLERIITLECWLQHYELIHHTAKSPDVSLLSIRLVL